MQTATSARNWILCVFVLHDHSCPWEHQYSLRQLAYLKFNNALHKFLPRKRRCRTLCLWEEARSWMGGGGGGMMLHVTKGL